MHQNRIHIPFLMGLIEMTGRHLALYWWRSRFGRRQPRFWVTDVHYIRFRFDYRFPLGLCFATDRRPETRTWSLGLARGAFLHTRLVSSPHSPLGKLAALPAARICPVPPTLHYLLIPNPKWARKWCALDQKLRKQQVDPAIATFWLWLVQCPALHRKIKAQQQNKN